MQGEKSRGRRLEEVQMQWQWLWQEEQRQGPGKWMIED